MEDFIVSARKYRPLTFDSVVGQSHITTTLKNAIRLKHLAQAFLFCGPRGVGKTTCARILAKTINCENLEDTIEPCGTCHSCLSFQKNNSLSIQEIDAASNNLVEDIRNLIDQVRYPPQIGKYKIYIIDEVHMLSTAAFNAFLKTLEEPPSYAIFILATTEKHKILPTILSRCQIFDFNRISTQDIVQHLSKIAIQENIKTETEALEIIAQKSEGGLRDALSMFDMLVTFSSDNSIRYTQVLENLHILDYDYYFSLTDKLQNGDTSQTLLILDEILKKGFDLQQFLIGLMEHFRNLLISQTPSTLSILEISENIKKRYQEQSQNLTYEWIIQNLKLLNECDIHFKASKNQRLHVEIYLIKIAFPFSTSTNSNKIIPSEIIEKKKDNLPPPPVSTATAVALKRTQIIVENTKKVEVQADLSREKIAKALEDFSRVKELANDNQTVMLLKCSFSWSEESINLTIREEDLLESIQQELLEFLQKKLSFPNLKLHFVAPEEVKQIPYTQEEKFDYLVQKNPLLQKLKDELGLTIRY